MKKQDVDLATLAIRNLIAHDIPTRLKSQEPVAISLSEAVPTLSPKALAYFNNRLKETLSKRGQMVEPDPMATSPVLPPEILSWLSAQAEPEVVAVSQLAARHLYEVQGGSTSQGLLAVSAAVLDGRRALTLMKLPHEEGLLLEPARVDGKPTLAVDVLDNLTLTQNTRVFKAGVFWLDDDALVGMLSDDQTGEATDLADFFLRQFLHCRRIRQPKVLTRMFRERVAAFISKEVADEDDKLDLYNALNTEMRSNVQRIDPVRFVQEHVPQRYQSGLAEVLREGGLRAAFRKDVEGLPNKGRVARVRTKGGLTISGGPEAIERIGTAEVDGDKVIVIRDSLESVQ